MKPTISAGLLVVGALFGCGAAPSGPEALGNDLAREAIKNQCDMAYAPAVAAGTGTVECANQCTSLVTIDINPMTKKCRAKWELYAFAATKKKQPVLGWTIFDSTKDRMPANSADGSANPDAGGPRYRFDKDWGIAMCPQSKVTPDDLKLHGKCVDGDACQVYQWKAINKRKRDKGRGQGSEEEREINFGIAVLDTKTGEVCEAQDPVIINRGQ